MADIFKTTSTNNSQDLSGVSTHSSLFLTTIGFPKGASISDNPQDLSGNSLIDRHLLKIKKKSSTPLYFQLNLATLSGDISKAARILTVASTNTSNVKSSPFRYGQNFLSNIINIPSDLSVHVITDSSEPNFRLDKVYAMVVHPSDEKAVDSSCFYELLLSIFGLEFENLKVIILHRLKIDYFIAIFLNSLNSKSIHLSNCFIEPKGIPFQEGLRKAEKLKLSLNENSLITQFPFCELQKLSIYIPKVEMAGKKTPRNIQINLRSCKNLIYL